MKNLEQISPSRLTNLQVVQFMRDSRTDIMNTNVSQLQSDAPLKRYLEKFDLVDKFDKGIVNIAGNPLSEEMNNKDALRDTSFRNFGRHLRYFEYSEDENESKAAQILTQLWNVHKDTPTMQPQKQTSATDNFLSDLANEPHASAAATLKLQGDIDRIKSSNDAYRTLWDDKRTQDIQREIVDTKGIKVELMSNYRDLAQYILSMAKANDDNAEWRKLLDALNAARKRYAETMRRQKSAAEASAKKSEDKSE